MIHVCVAGATGWTGRALVPAIVEAKDLELRSAVARSAAGTDVGIALGGEPVNAPVFGSVADALEGVDVLVDFTAPDVVKPNVLLAVERGVAAVVGTSGLTAEDYAEIDAAARSRGVGVVAAGNFSLTAALAQAAALLAARHLPAREIVDYASATKPDVPSGTALELAERLAEVRPPDPGRPLEELHGPVETRGAAIAGTRVHSVRLPGFVVSTEVVFGLPDERLVIRHDAGSSAEPYVHGALMAIRAVRDRVGLTRGLDTLLLEGDERGHMPR